MEAIRAEAKDESLWKISDLRTMVVWEKMVES